MRIACNPYCSATYFLDLKELLANYAGMLEEPDT